MPHLHRFHISPGAPAGDRVVLPEEGAHHALRVARLRQGAPVVLFDGAGRELTGTLVPEGRRDASVAVTGERFVPRPAPALTIALAWLHRDKPVEELIRRGTELGVGGFVFFPSARSERAPKVSDKWSRVAVEAAKQCGVLWLPSFAVAEGLDDVLDRAAGDVLVADMQGETRPLEACLTGADATLLVGPEGDFTGEELALARSRGAKGISLGPHTFRSEVAAVVGATLVAYAWGRLGPR